MEAERTNFYKEMEKYKNLQFVVPDLHCVPRGKVFSGRFKDKTARTGYEASNVICMMGPRGNFTLSISKFMGNNWPNHHLRPCMETLTPLPWIGDEGRRAGNVLCDLFFPDGTPDITSPRQLLQAQIKALRERHGLIIKSAFEYEFTVFKQDTLEPLGTNETQCYDMNVWGDHEKLFSDLVDVLDTMGIEVSSLTPEYPQGQWEITTEPMEGVRGGDTGFYVKNAVKGFLATRGYHATFMSKPTANGPVSGLHLNHSLWRLRESGDGEDNVFLDGPSEGREAAIQVQGQDPFTQVQGHGLSSTARHWLAGLLKHAPALCALLCPTVNCYRRLFSLATPSHSNWGMDDRFALIRVRNSGGNIFFENRLPSSAVNPYLAIAATVAAGLDGLDRKLECPAPRDTTPSPQQGGTTESSDPKRTEMQMQPEDGTEHSTPRNAIPRPQTGDTAQALELPRSLNEALDALENDKELCALLGDRFVGCYVIVKRDTEVKAVAEADLKSLEEELAFERKLYLTNL